MNEPPGARARVALTGLTVAEYFRDQEGQDVLLFIDNIFRFTQAGSEVSALLGRIPSAVGYQPTLATDMGTMQERITTTKKGSITSVQVHIFSAPAPKCRRAIAIPPASASTSPCKMLWQVLKSYDRHAHPVTVAPLVWIMTWPHPCVMLLSG